MDSKLHHIHLVSHDMKSTADFFVEELGATFVAFKKFSGVDGIKLDLGGLSVNIRVPKNQVEDSRSKKDASWYDHIGLEVEDLDEAYRELSGKGYVFTQPPHELGDLKVAYFLGPGDLIIELLQNRK